MGVFKNAVGAGDVVDFIGARGPGEVPKASADRARQSDVLARAKNIKKIRNKAVQQKKRVDAGLEKTAQRAKVDPEFKAKVKAVQQKRKDKEAATTATVSNPLKLPFTESLETSIKNMLGEKND